ncbi:flagella basal body P-ring formation protein FlgA [Sphingomonadaceae bacterium G21617-S1]|nr:flagella basal body P-ring formation protein FlgA [Sphingomonadaceae bacterium G21617-S1]
MNWSIAPMRMIVPALLMAAAAPALAQSALPPAQDLDQLERMVIATLGVGIGEPGGPMAPIDRRMRLAACPGGIQIDPPSPGAVTVRCTTNGWRIRVPLTRPGSIASSMAANYGNGGSGNGGYGGQQQGLANAAVRKGDPVQLVAQGAAFSISVDATAMEDAAIGGRVRVTSPTRGAVMFAEVVDIGKVRLMGFK